MEDELGYGAPQDREQPLILIADDDPEIRTLLRLHFSSMDCDLLETADGAETLESVIMHKPNLVILDVMMPELSGWEICKYIKEREEEYAATGVIMLTAIGEVNNSLTSPLFGADDYMDKPFDFEELDFKVRKVLSEKRSD
ncbi:MAG: response regulator [Myxococcota bacterium]